MATNKEVIEAIYAEMAKGNARPLVEHMADHVRWTLAGTRSWGRTYAGKESVRKDLLRPLGAAFAGPYTAVAKRILADGEFVVAEVEGSVLTKSGVPYNNAYCFIYRFADGLIVEITEYMDTELATVALGNPDQFAVEVVH